MQSWDKEQSEPPLKIAVKDMNGNHPMSLAFLRGHIDVAKAILDIIKAQYAPEDKGESRFRLETTRDDDSEDEDEDEDDDDSEPRIVAETVDKKFTIENVGQVSMQVKSRTRPLDVLSWAGPTFKVRNGEAVHSDMAATSLLRFVVRGDDHAGLKALLDMGIHFASQKLDGDEEASGVSGILDGEFIWVVQNGRTQMLAEIIRRVGAGIPLDHLVKKSGVEAKAKPRYYQGLTVYGKKR